MSRILVVCTTDSMIWNFLIPHIKELEKHGHYVECACSETGFFYDELLNVYGIKMNKVPFKRNPYSFRNIKAYRKVCKIIEDKNIDTVFCHEPVGGVIGRLAGHREKCRVVYMAHGFHFYKGAPKRRILYFWIEKYLSRYTDKLITINDEDYNQSLAFKRCKCYKLNGIGIDTTKFVYNANEDYLKNELKIPSCGIVFLSVGELIRRKNHESIIKALSLLNNPNIFYVIAGEGERRKQLTNLIHKCGLENNVFLLGYRQDVKELYNSADVFVMPSIHEGLSVALMEAMSCGKPIIASRIRGNVDLVKGDFGILCDTFSVNDYAKSIKEMYDHIDSWAIKGMQGIQEIKKYDIEVIKKDLLDVFGDE